MQNRKQSEIGSRDVNSVRNSRLPNIESSHLDFKIKLVRGPLP